MIIRVLSGARARKSDEFFFFLAKKWQLQKLNSRLLPPHPPHPRPLPAITRITRVSPPCPSLFPSPPSPAPCEQTESIHSRQKETARGAVRPLATLCPFSLSLSLFLPSSPPSSSFIHKGPFPPLSHSAGLWPLLDHRMLGPWRRGAVQAAAAPRAVLGTQPSQFPHFLFPISPLLPFLRLSSARSLLPLWLCSLIAHHFSPPAQVPRPPPPAPAYACSRPSARRDLPSLRRAAPLALLRRTPSQPCTQSYSAFPKQQPARLFKCRLCPPLLPGSALAAAACSADRSRACFFCCER